MFSHYHVLPRCGKGGSVSRYMHAIHSHRNSYILIFYLAAKTMLLSIIVDNKRKAARWAGRVRAGRHERYNTK